MVWSLRHKSTRRKNNYCAIEQSLGWKEEYGYAVLVSRDINEACNALIRTEDQYPELQIDLVQEEDDESDDEPSVF